MGIWFEKKLGELLTQRKEQVIIQPEIEYSLVTITNKSEVRLREKKKGALIRAKKGYVTKAGDFIYSRLSVHTGAFGIVPEKLENALITNEMPCFQIDKTLIHPKIVLDLVGMPGFQWKLKQLTKGMGRVRVKESMMLGLKVTFPEPSRQQSFVDKIDEIKKHKCDLDNELSHQQTLLKKIRQQLLQEAIEGKLTSNWRAENPDVEPASELLERIQAEKAKLIKDKKIKKQKSMPPISEEEKTFELPERWAWCRLGNISEVKVGATPARGNPEYWGGNINWVSSGEVANNYISITKETITTKGEAESSAKINPKGSVLVAMIGQGKTRGQTAILNIDAATNQNVAAIRLSKKIIPEIIWYFFLSRYEATRSGASGGNQPALNGIKISNTVFALPPAPEVKVIINWLRRIEQIIEQLETQITSNQSYAKQLMPVVLKEAFTQNSEQTEQEANHAN